MTEKLQSGFKLRRRLKTQKSQPDKNATQTTVTANPLKILVTVVNRNKTEFYLDLIQSFDVNLHTVVLAKGTADANMLRYLGLTDAGKSVILSVVQQKKLPEALDALDKKFRTVKDGKGIAFTIPLTSVIGALLFGFLSNNKSVVKEDK
ncbi:MAG TPA: hypothetical protein IAB94_00810 [Candidatus Coproplasma avicola]|uniref:Uncharacterized protein n=1 Tax=Candidatus Coproplasma avicola TaxID=2840744 RepID=A0A9D1E5Q5_9FIRM|nr:hypothetical protein [Candidatus Coproplasma avicola]